MRGQIKVLGASESFKNFIDYDGYGSLLSINEKICLLQLAEKKITYQIYRMIYCENHIEYEGWANLEENTGKIAIKFSC